MGIIECAKELLFGISHRSRLLIIWFSDNHQAQAAPLGRRGRGLVVREKLSDGLLHQEYYGKDAQNRAEGHQNALETCDDEAIYSGPSLGKFSAGNDDTHGQGPAAEHEHRRENDE